MKRKFLLFIIITFFIGQLAPTFFTLDISKTKAAETNVDSTQSTSSDLFNNQNTETLIDQLINGNNISGISDSTNLDENSFETDESGLVTNEEPEVTDDDLQAYEDFQNIAMATNLSSDGPSNLKWWATEASKKLVLTPEDTEKLRNKEVDARVADYLYTLVTPESEGGYGFSRIKASSIFKKYTTDGVGKNDNESLADPTDEIDSFHHTGQAVDITEADTITCKIRKNYVWGSTTKTQKPSAIKVGWQTKDGITKNPTPTGTSLVGMSGELSANALLNMMNNTGLMDDSVDFIKGMDLGTIIAYIGLNIYMKKLGITTIVSDPLADTFIHVVGGAILESAMPGLAKNVTYGDNNDDARVAFAKGRLEEGLQLPPGSLRKYGWDGILESVGKRTLENNLGLPALWFENHKLEEANALPGMQEILHNKVRNNDALNVIDGTIESIEKKDPKAFKLAGINAISTSLKLKSEQKDQLKALVMEGKPTGTINVNFGSLALDEKINIEDLINIFSDKDADHKKAEQSLLNQGLDIASGVLKNKIPSQFQAIANDLVTSLKNKNKKITLGEVKQNLGAAKIAEQSNDANTAANLKTLNAAATAGIVPPTALPTTSSTSSTGGGAAGSAVNKPNKDKMQQFYEMAANSINTEYKLPEGMKVSAGEFKETLQAKNSALAEKIGSAEVDKALGWEVGTAYQVIKNKITLIQAFEQNVSKSLGKLMGIDVPAFSLDGDMYKNYGRAIIGTRLGIDRISLGEGGKAKDGSEYVATDWTSEELESVIGADKFKDKFMLSTEDAKAINADIIPQVTSGSYLNNQDGYQSTIDPDTIAKIEKTFSIDNLLNVSHGSTLSFLRGEMTVNGLADKVAGENVRLITVNKIWDQFDLQDTYKISGDEANVLITDLTRWKDISNEERSRAIGIGVRLITRSNDQQANFIPETFLKWATARNENDRTKILLAAGVRLIATQFGIELGDVSDDVISGIVNNIDDVFNNPLRLQDASQEMQSLARKAGIVINPDNPALNDTQRAQARTKLTNSEYDRLVELTKNGAVIGYTYLENKLVGIAAKAFGIPQEFMGDVYSLVKGDFPTAWASFGYKIWKKSINQYLPYDAQLTYEEYRGMWYPDEAEVATFAEQTYTEMQDGRAAQAGFTGSFTYSNGAGGTINSTSLPTWSQLSPAAQSSIKENSRKSIVNKNQRNVQDKISDGFLRKQDPNIPVGFSHAMLHGNNTERGMVLQEYAMNFADSELVKALPGIYNQGMLQRLWDNPQRAQGEAFATALRASGISAGPFTTEFLAYFVQFVATPREFKNDFFTNSSYSGMWNYFDKWLGDTLGINSIPSGLSKSLFYFADQGFRTGNWDLNASLMNGKTPIVESLTKIGRDWLTSELTKWADKVLNLPIGTAMQVVKLTQTLINASKWLTVVNDPLILNTLNSAAPGVGDQMQSAARADVKAAQGAIWVFVITTALNLCKECQEFFGSIDKALGVPAGFTNAVVGGGIAMLFNVGPWGAFAAAVLILIMGVVSVDYLCPQPPPDTYGVKSFDSADDNPEYKWDNSEEVLRKYWNKESLPYTDGNNPDVWELWARFNVGRLIDKTLEYGVARERPYKPLQVITYRQANVEYYGESYLQKAFGEGIANLPGVGLGFSKGNSNLTDWVHVAFGGSG